MRTIFAEYNPQCNSIDVYTSAGNMLRIDCGEAEKNLTTTPGSDYASYLPDKNPFASGENATNPIFNSSSTGNNFSCHHGIAILYCCYRADCMCPSEIFL